MNEVFRVSVARFSPVVCGKIEGKEGKETLGFRVFLVVWKKRD